jgi:hypothetical protein
MHSIFVHLVDVPRDELSEYFDAHAERGLREHWYSPSRADPDFSIRFPHGNSDFRDAENRAHVVRALGREPDLTVQFDAGAKRPGHKQLRAFLVSLLSEYTGVALDDLSPHVWTVEELRADAHVHGFGFADHELWRKQHQIPRATVRPGDRGGPTGGRLSSSS